MVDKKAIYNDLVKEFIGYQWRLENPMPATGETEEMIIAHFQTDAIFNRRVNRLVAGVMHVLDRHL
ncbi:MAG: hypothetical protein ACJA1I_000560 [Zhongshania marina]|jgi:hypothetical protein